MHWCLWERSTKRIIFLQLLTFHFVQGTNSSIKLRLIQGCSRFPEIWTFFVWEFRRHRNWSLNRQFQCKSMKNYRPLQQLCTPLLVTSGVQDWRSVQMYSHEKLSPNQCWHPVAIEACPVSKWVCIRMLSYIGSIFAGDILKIRSEIMRKYKGGQEDTPPPIRPNFFFIFMSFSRRNGQTIDWDPILGNPGSATGLKWWNKFGIRHVYFSVFCSFHEIPYNGGSTLKTRQHFSRMCTAVGCVHRMGSVPTETPWTENPSPWTETPGQRLTWTETSPGQRLPWTEIPLLGPGSAPVKSWIGPYKVLDPPL